MKVLSVGLLCLATLVLGTVASSMTTTTNTGTITSGNRWFDYVVVIMLENHGINETYGTQCNGNCTYFSFLANTNGLAERYNSGGVSGSLGDYIALTSGDGSVQCNTPPSGICGPFKDVNIVDRIEGRNLTWRAYMEDYPGSGSGSSYSSGGCFMKSSGNYLANHNPFIYYQDIIDSNQRCSRILAANSVIPSQSACGSSTSPGIVETDDVLLNDLNSVSSASNYIFLSPNSIDDLHDCPSGDVSLGNHYLELLVPQILNSTIFRTKRAALFITFDEVDPFVGNARDQYSVWASQSSTTTKSAFKSNLPYNHYYALRTVEDNFGLASINATDAGLSYDMSEFFK